MDRKLYPIFRRFTGQTFTESLEICQVKVITFFFIQQFKNILMMSSYEEEAKRHKQIHLKKFKEEPNELD